MANLHVDVNIITQDLVDLVDGFRTSSHAHEKHKELSYKLSDPHCHNRKQAKFGIVVNCVSCANSVSHSLHTVWQRGMPVHISLADGECPHCDGKKGFHFAQVKTLHA
jgi:hypothetical protein